jgi:hypothetical protein
MHKHLLNCINVSSYANERNVTAEHTGSTRDQSGTAWQRYRVHFPGRGFVNCRVRCSEYSQFNDILEME